MRYLVTVLLLLSVLTASAQRYSFKTLATIKDQKSTSDLTKFGSRFYGIKADAKAKFGWTMTLDKMRQSNTLLAYDEQINLVKETELNGGKELYGPFSSQYKVLNNKLYFLYYGYEKDKGIEIYAAEVDTTSLSLKEAKRVMTIDQKNVGLFKIVDLYYSFSFKIQASQDRSKYLFLWFPGTQENFFYGVTDDKLNKISDETGTITNAKDPALQNCLVDNAGNVYVAYKWKKKDNYYAGLVTHVNGVKKEANLGLTKGTPNDVYVFNGENAEQVRVAGTYSLDGYYISGIFSLNLDKKGLGVKGLLQKDIPEDIMEKLDKDAFAKTKKKDYGVYPEIYFEGIEFDNGTILMAGDPVRYQARGANASSIEVTGPTLVLLFNKSDIIIKRLPKREIMGVKSSFFLHKRGNTAILMYTDLEGSLEKPVDQGEVAGWYSRKNNVIVAATVEADGRISRKILYPDTPDDFYFTPGFATSIDADNILMALGKDKATLTRYKTTQKFYLLNIAEE